MTPADALAERRAELARKLAALSPEKREQLERARVNGSSSAAHGGITPRSAGAPTPMSFAQELLWLLDRANPGMHGYNVPRTARLRGALDVRALSAALDAVVARHEVLRSTFDLVDGEPRQIVHEPSLVHLEITDLREEPCREDAAVALVRELSRRPFDLTSDSQLRASLLVLDEDDHVLLLESHHVSSDAWSRNILMRELAAFYDAHRSGTDADVAPLEIQYGDFAVWQRETLQGDALERHLAFWRQQLRGAPALLELPTDRPRPAMPSFDGDSRSRLLPVELLERLRALSKANGSTLFVTLLAAFDVFLARLSGQDDVVVGSPTAGRSQEGTEALIGYFANTLVLRTKLSGDPSFTELLARVRETTLSAFEHQDVPYEKLVLELQRERALGRGGLFQVMFTLQDAQLRTLQLPGLTFEPFGMARGATKFDLSLFMHEREDGLRAAFEYRTDLFDQASVDRMLARFEVLLDEIANGPDARISTLRMLPDDERRTLLDEWSGGDAQPLEAATLHEMIAQQVARTPDAVAVEVESPSGALERISFRELDDRAEMVARYLSHLGVGPNIGVGICIDRSVDLVVAMLGVLKAGSYYLPLDPDYPESRLAFMLEDAAVPVLLTVSALESAVPRTTAGDGPTIVVLDRDWQRIVARAGRPASLPNAPNAEGLAYVIYTSGSTGKPKGVMIPHRAVVNYLTWMRAEYPLDTTDAVLQKAPASFDACIWEFFLPLVSGARLVLARPGGQQDPAYLLSTIATHDITLLQLVPSQLQMMLETDGVGAPDGLPRLRRLFLGGEALPPELLGRLADVCPSLEVTNLYGPTEATVYATHWSVRASEWTCGVVPIGRPIAGASIHIVTTPEDKSQRRDLSPIGVAGELCIGGVGLAHGYLNRPELTDEKFVRDPFSTDANARLYCTGDRARYRADGSLEYLGRIDNQVKLRGFRVELAEIETTLTQQPGVRSAVVLVREDVPGDQRLVAYCIAAPESDVEPQSAAELRRALKTTLPEFMVPSAFVWMNEWPMNANGKLDRKALPAPNAGDAPAAATHVAPRTSTESMVGELWAEVLQREVGAHDDFFELGGHSLLALRMLARVGERFGVRIPLRAIFDSSTLDAFATRVDEAVHAARGAIVTGDVIPRVADEAPLTHLQEVFWLIERNTPGLGVYNVSDRWRLTGELDAGALRRALDALVDRHEAFRSVIVERDDGPVQTIRPARPFSLEVIDLTSLSHDERENENARVCAERASAPFDLSADQLLRATLVRLAANDHVLLLVSHHIVYDGWSRGVLLRELSVLYAHARGGRVPPLRMPAVRFVDYAAWQRSRLDVPATQRELRQWVDRLASSSLTVELPSDRPRPSVPSFEGGKRTVVLPPDLLERLKRVARDADATLFMVLLAGFQSLLHRYSGQDDLVVGTIVAGRARPELDDVIGNFVNTVPLRAAFDDDPTFHELLSRVKEEYLHASEHAELPFETLADTLQRERGAEASGFAQVHFVLQNTAPSPFGLSGVQSRPVAIESTTTKFDLSLSMGEQRDGLRAAMQYRSALFDPETIDRMLEHLGVLLDGVSRAPGTRVSDLPLLGADERQRLLVDWNGETVDYARDATVHGLVSEQAARAPGAIALSTHTGESMRYGELDALSNQLASYLRKLGVEPGSVVGICIEPSVNLVVAMLATLKTGAAYLTLDPSYPPDRLTFMVEDAGIAALVVAAGTRAHPIPLTTAPRVSLTMDAAAIAACPLKASPQHTTGADVANIVYTSGSTGTPKGTLLPHRGIVRLVTRTNYMQLDPSDVMAQVASPAFDALTWEVWGALLNGARLAIVPRDVMLDAQALQEEVQRAGITTMLLTTAVFNQVARTTPAALRGVKNMLFGGEAADVESVRRVLAYSAPLNLVNAYGPTEGSVIALTHRVAALTPEATTVPVGRPISNTRVFVLDRRGRLAPIGVPGELHIAGDGTALGYLNREELTAERFVVNPLVSGERMYRTGDLVRWLPSGTIEFLGRADNQVKIRGVRIELGEVETVLSAEPGVGEALAIVREIAPGDSRLICYFVPEPGASPDPTRLRVALRRVLPQNMMPSAIVQLEAFPITQNGKVDRRALPIPELSATLSAPYKKPRTTIEHEMVQIWEKLLDRRPIGIREDFFELGGHSLLAVRMLSEVARVRGRHIPLAWLFESSTIELLVARIDADMHATSEPPLIELNAEATDTPLAFVHGDGHGAGWYCRRLAPLAAPGAPFFVLPTLGADPEQRAWRIETMAERHVTQLRKVQPIGPYRLAGYCVGGIIAYEMACQLRKAGETVERVIMIDSGAANARIPLARMLLAFVPGRSAQSRLTRKSSLMKRLRRYDLHLRQVRRLDTARQLAWVRNNFVRRWRRLRDSLNHTQAQRQQPALQLQQQTTESRLAALHDEAIGEKVMITQENAALVYFMGRYDGTVDLIYSQASADVKRRDPTRDWWRVVKDVRVHTIVAHHIGLITNDLPKMASVLREILDRPSR
ncbi:MAG: amino acid adenylation domain-containing protein [bacterium]